MVELKFGLRTVDLPYTIRIPDVTETIFDELVDDDTKAELIDGVMIVHSPASPRHGDVSGFIRFLMGYYSAWKKLGKVFGPECLIHLATCRLFAPDFFFLARSRLPRRLPKKQFEGPFDLVGEVLSPSTRDDDLNDKRPAYQAAGVQEIWFIDLDDQQVIVDHRHKKKYTSAVVTKGQVASKVLPGFWIEASWLWMEPLPNELECMQEILS